MTIKELENRTGMTRANIRFYEGEGLLSPRRLDNGYRDYSEEDARTLEKIKLLRQLQLDIDTIRKVQDGALTLEQALFSLLTKLEGDKAMLERAAEVCRQLERSGVEYAALDPQPWLSQLQAPSWPGLPEPSPVSPEEERDDGDRACYHPWMRLFARALDMALYDTLINAVWLLAARNLNFLRMQTGSALGQWVWGLVMLGLTLVLEPFWLHYWGWTPGKWMFGLKLRDEKGRKLTISQGLWRCGRLAGEGYGFNIPIYCWWRMWKGKQTGLEGEDCPWDCEEGYRYTKVERRFEVMAFIAVRAACAAALLLAALWAELPPNRGDLTVAEFAQNYDHFFTQLVEQNTTTVPTLDEEGHWKEAAFVNGAVVIHMGPGITAVTDGVGNAEPGSFETAAVWTVWDEPEYTAVDGRVTAVTLHMESNDYMVSSGTREFLALLALSGSVDGLNLFNFDLTGWSGIANKGLRQWEDVELDYRGLHISQRVAYEGYGLRAFGGELAAQYEENGDDIPRRCEKTVTISLIE